MRKKIVLAIVVVCILSLSVITVYANRNTPNNAEDLNNYASTLANSMQTLFAQDNTASSIKPYLAASKDSACLEVMDEYISPAYFAQRVQMYRLSNYEDPVENAIAATKREVYEFQFAEQHDLLPTYDECIERCKQEQEEFEKDPDAKTTAQYLLDQIGLSWDEYWTVYKPKYEMPVQIVKENVYTYLQDNDLDSLNYDDVTVTILDQGFIDKCGSLSES